MDFSPEWEKRVEIWIEELPKYFYQPLAGIEFEGFTTLKMLSPEQAEQEKFFPMPVGTKWGTKWEYGWFRGNIRLPKTAKGHRIVARLSVGGESLVFINGKAAGAKDKQHTEIVLSNYARGLEEYKFLIESYAGHGPRLENGAPCPPDYITVTEPENTQVIVGNSTFGIWDDNAYQLWMDMQTLWQVRNNINKKSLRFQKVQKVLREATLIADFELPTAELRSKTFAKAREILAAELACQNGSTAPTMYIFGQSHLDLAWLWPQQETIRKSARTVSNQMALMEEYPHYKFFWCEPPLYIALKEHYPELYKRVKEKFESGQMMTDGAMWVESDTNLPNGESLIRQIMYGRRFYKEELGVDSRMVWLPDCFGFTAALPQIMKGCGVKYFATQKIIRNYNGGDPFPYNVFMWEGIDGSKILSHIYKKNNAFIDPETMITRWEQDRNQQEDIEYFLYPFGYGDGGGGPVRDHIEFMNRMSDLEGVPRTEIHHPEDFFHKVEETGGTQNRYVGELYFQAHRGTYTSQARIKKGNRKGEFALRDAEMWCALANNNYPAEKLEQLWKILLFNQFHDVLPGASITRVCEEAHNDYENVILQSNNLIKKAQEKLTKGEGVTVFNSLSWERKAQVALPLGMTGATDEQGNLLDCQKIGDLVYAEINLPSCGFNTFYPNSSFEPCKEQETDKTFVLENEYLRVKLDGLGRIASAIDKEIGRELISAPANDIKMYRDTTTKYEAWDLDSSYIMMPVSLSNEAQIKWVTKGKLRQTISIVRKLNNSNMIQEISLEKGSRVLSFKTEIDWKERHKLLKVDFPTTVLCDEALHEIQYGYIKRPTHRSRQYDKDRFEVCNHKWTALTEENRGCAVLNDCKYGVSTEGNCISLTLLRAPLVPDMYADKCKHEFTYGFNFWNDSMLNSDVVNKAYEMNVPVTTSCGSGSRSFIRASNKNIIIDCVKRSEGNHGELILRLYQSKKATQNCVISLDMEIIEAWETTMIEEKIHSLKTEGNNIQLAFSPFEVKTISIKYI